MSNILPLCAALAALAFGLLPPTAAKAELDTYVAAVGSNTGTCPITSPCGSIGYALSQTTSGGVLHCIGAGDFAGALLTITISVTIDCEEFHAGLNAFIINGPGITVVIRGGRIIGNDVTAIDFKNGAALIVERVEISENSPTGIFFEPSADAQLRVTDSLIVGNTNASTPAGGIWIKPGSGVIADVAIDNSRVVDNTFGIVADGTGGGKVTGTVSNSVVSGNTEDGIAAISSGSSAFLLVDQTKASGNAFGLATGGSGAELLVRNSSVLGNTTGLRTANGSTLYSYGNNSVNGNTTNGAFTGTVGMQ